MGVCLSMVAKWTVGIYFVKTCTQLVGNTIYSLTIRMVNYSLKCGPTYKKNMCMPANMLASSRSFSLTLGIDVDCSLYYIKLVYS